MNDGNGNAPAAPGRVTGRTWLQAALAVATIGWGAQQFTPLLLLYKEGYQKLSSRIFCGSPFNCY